MIDLIRRIFGLLPAPDYKELVENGAVILDVRTKAEYNAGHIKGSANYPLDRLPADCDKIRKDCIIITCCASGMRSAAARRILRSKGYGHVFNGGGWIRLQHKIS